MSAGRRSGESRLEKDDRVRAASLGQRVLHDVEHRRLVAGKLRGAVDHLDAELSSGERDLRRVR